MCFLFAVAAYSQQYPDTIFIQEVRITIPEKDDNLGMSQTKIDSFSILQSQGLNISDLLSRHSSVYIKNTGRGLLSTASFRGTDASHTKVYWNGMHVNSPMLGQTDLSLIPVCFLEGISLLHGGSSLRSGSGAFGGAIQLENKTDWMEKTGFMISQEVASFHTYQTTGSVNIKISNWLFKTRFQYGQSKNDYPFTNNGIKPVVEDRLRNSEYVRSGLLQEIYFRPGDHNLLAARIWYQQADRNLPQTMSYEGVGREENQLDKNLRASLSWNHYRPNSQLEVRSGISHSGLNYFLKSATQEYTHFD